MRCAQEGSELVSVLARQAGSGRWLGTPPGTRVVKEPEAWNEAFRLERGRQGVVVNEAGSAYISLTRLG